MWLRALPGKERCDQDKLISVCKSSGSDCTVTFIGTDSYSAESKQNLQKVAQCICTISDVSI